MQVKIGPITYDVDMSEPAPQDEESISTGRIIYYECKIRVGSDLPQQYQRLVLLHEIVHGIFMNAGKQPGEHGEELVNLIAHGLLDFLQENPMAVAYLQGRGVREE